MNAAALAATVSRRDEFARLPRQCFIHGCHASDVDERGPVFTRDGRMHRACPEHWEAIMKVLGEQSSWLHDAMHAVHDR